LRIDYRVVLPEAVYDLSHLDEVARTAPLDRKLLELVELRASQLNGCRHCVDLHVSNATVLGEDAERLRLVSSWRDAAVFSERERAALSWCEELTVLPGNGSSSETFDLLIPEFDPKEIVALTASIIAVNGRNRLHIGLGPPSGEIDFAAPLPAKEDPRVRHLTPRLRELEAELAKVREDYRRLVEGPPGPRSYESGTIHPELDDQAITPPG
jgi:AhpD family alkylhydroperoxidase